MRKAVIAAALALAGRLALSGHVVFDGLTGPDQDPFNAYAMVLVGAVLVGAEVLRRRSISKKVLDRKLFKRVSDYSAPAAKLFKARAKDAG